MTDDIGEAVKATAETDPENRSISVAGLVGALVERRVVRGERGRFAAGTPTASFETGERSELLDLALAPRSKQKATEFLRAVGYRRPAADSGQASDEHGLHAGDLQVANLPLETAADAWGEATTKREAFFVLLGDSPATATAKIKAISAAHDSAIDREARTRKDALELAEKFREKIDVLELFRRSRAEARPEQPDERAGHQHIGEHEQADDEAQNTQARVGARWQGR